MNDDDDHEDSFIDFSNKHSQLLVKHSQQVSYQDW